MIDRILVGIRQRLPVLTDHRFPGVLALMVLVLSLPALGVGFQGDDWLQQALVRDLEPVGIQRTVIGDYFSFMDGNPDRNKLLRDMGFLPWWASLDLMSRFWRPIAAATHLADHLIAPTNPVFAHAQSIVWGVVLILIAGALYRRVLGTTVLAGLATLLFALDEGHGLPIGWIANRNALISGCFGFSALLLFVRWREERWLPGAFLAPLTLGLGLLTGESALATTAYLFSYVVFLDKGALTSRLSRLLPFVGVVVGWRLAYSALGYGTYGSGLYLDPLTQPGLYGLAFLQRAPVLLADQLLNFPSIPTSFVQKVVAIPVAVVLVGVLFLLVRAFSRALHASATARFWTVGMLLSLLPASATFPSSRLLIFVGLGGAGLVAEFLEKVLLAPTEEEIGGKQPGDSTRKWAWAMALLHLVVAPIAFAPAVYLAKPMNEFVFNPCEESLPHGVEIIGKTAVFVTSNDLCVAYVPYIRAVKGEPGPAQVRLLASALYDLEVEGVDDHAIEIRIPDGMQSNPADSLLRSADRPLKVGEVVSTPGVRFKVLGWNDRNLVNRFEVRFDRELWDPELLWVCTRERKASPFVPPRKGEVVQLKKAF